MKVLFKLILFFTSLLLSLTIFEIGVRFLDLDYNPNPYWRFHPRLGWTQETDVTFRFQEGGANLVVEFNRLGFRDVDHELEKPAGVRRLVVLGDSFSEAIQVNLDQTYWRELGRLLSAAGGEPWEVINLGVGDWGNTQALLALREYGLQFQPDLVVSQIFPLNDICNNSIQLAHLCKSQNDDYRPYFRLDENRRLVPAWTQPLRRWLRTHLISFGVLELAKARLLAPEIPETVEEKHLRLSRERGFQADPLLLTYASDRRRPPQLQEGWETTEAVLAETFRTCQERNIPWVAVVAPFEGRINEAWPQLAQALEEFELDADYPERRLSGFFQQLGAPAVMLKPLFEAHREAVLPYIGGHFNPQAHLLTAQALADRILEAGILGIENSENRE